jgi:hypothetical protein
MEIYNQLVAAVAAAKDDVEKFYAKGNKSAGTRVRKHMQEIKNLAHSLRVDVLDLKKGPDEE